MDFFLNADDYEEELCIWDKGYRKMDSNSLHDNLYLQIRIIVIILALWTIYFLDQPLYLLSSNNLFLYYITSSHSYVLLCILSLLTIHL